MNRRKFIKSAAIISGAAWGIRSGASFSSPAVAPPKQFKLAVISDGFSPDFESALKILQSYKVQWVEIRSVWGKYNTEASPEQVRHLKELLDQYAIRCSQVDTALFKCTLPGTNPPGADKDMYPYSAQMDLLKRAIERAHAWGTDRVRIFTFWRVAEPEQIHGRSSRRYRRPQKLRNPPAFD